MLQLRDLAESILPVSRIDTVQKAQRRYPGSSDREYHLWVYLRGRRDHVAYDYGTGEEAIANRNKDIKAIMAEGSNQGL